MALILSVNVTRVNNIIHYYITAFQLISIAEIPQRCLRTFECMWIQSKKVTLDKALMEVGSIMVGAGGLLSLFT